MPDHQTQPRYRVGDKIQVRIGSPLVGTVTEVRYTPFGSGPILYRLYIPMSSEPLMLEVREDEVECLVPHA
jgi:hypothetical protein